MLNKKHLLPGLLVFVCLLYAAVVNPAASRIGEVPVLPVIFAVIFLIQLVGFGYAWWARTERFYDLIGSFTFITAVLLALLLNPLANAYHYVVGALVVTWALRLGSFLFLRIADVGEDQRFRKIKQSFWRFLLVWTLQGVWVSVTSSAALVAILTPDGAAFSVFSGLGFLIWFVGFGLEIIADKQKANFRKNPENAGRFICRGLWSVCRHPNYLGEILLWTGIFLAALPLMQGWQFMTLLSPVFVVILLTRISGIPTLAHRGASLWGDDPAYQAYLRDTPVLIPTLSSLRRAAKS
jgi:steroid 5-alpha reductase family enzyme